MAASERDHVDVSAAPYEAPELTEYGTIEAWTQGARQIIQISIII